MDLALLVYGISLLQGIGTFFIIILCLCGLAMAGNFVYWVDGYGEDRTAGCKARSWKAFWVAVAAFWVLILIPSEKTAYTMEIYETCLGAINGFSITCLWYFFAARYRYFLYNHSLPLVS